MKRIACGLVTVWLLVLWPTTASAQYVIPGPPEPFKTERDRVESLADCASYTIHIAHVSDGGSGSSAYSRPTGASVHAPSVPASGRWLGRGAIALAGAGAAGAAAAGANKKRR